MTSEQPWPKRRTGPQVRVEKADAQAMELAPVIAQIRASGARTLQAIADELNVRGIQAVRAEKWGTSSVSRLRARIDKLKGITPARETMTAGAQKSAALDRGNNRSGGGGETP